MTLRWLMVAAALLLVSAVTVIAVEESMGGGYELLSEGNTPAIGCYGGRCLMVANRNAQIAMFESFDNGVTWTGTANTGTYLYGLNSVEVACVDYGSCMMAYRSGYKGLSIQRARNGGFWISKINIVRLASGFGLLQPKLDCVDSNTCLITYQVFSDTDPTLASVWVVQSTDYGNTWSAPIMLSGRENSGLDSSNPGLGCSPGGAVCVIAFRGAQAPDVESAVFLKRSLDQGSSWTNSTQLAVPEGVQVTNTFYPRVECATATSCVVVADLSNATSQWIAYAHTSDGGATWSQLKPLASRPQTQFAQPQVSCTAKQCAVAWHVVPDGSGTFERPMLAISHDGGQTFGAPQDYPIAQPVRETNEVYVACDRATEWCASVFVQRDPVTLYASRLMEVTPSPTVAPTLSPTPKECCHSTYPRVSDNVCLSLGCAPGTEAICGIGCDAQGNPAGNYNQSLAAETAPEQVFEKSRAREEAKTIAYALCGASIFCVVVCAALTWACRRNPVMRAAQPAYLAMILFGAALSSSSILFLIVDDGVNNLSLFEAFEQDQLIGTEDGGNQLADFACMASVWLFGVGFVIMYVALIVKMSTIRRIFAERVRTTATKRRNWKLKNVAVISTFVVLEVAVLGIWTSNDPLKYRRTFEIDGALQSKGMCDSETALTYLLILASLHLLLIAYALWIIYQTRNIHSAFSEGKHIRYAVYNGLQFSIIAIPILFFSDESSTSLLLRAGAVAIHDIGLLYLLFAPKFRIVWLGLDESEEATKEGALAIKQIVQMSNASKSKSHSLVSVDLSSDNPAANTPHSPSSSSSSNCMSWAVCSAKTKPSSAKSTPSSLSHYVSSGAGGDLSNVSGKGNAQA